MEGTILHHALFFLSFVFFVSDTIIAGKASSGAIRESKKLDFQENQMAFASSATIVDRQTVPGNVPVINPTPPGSTPVLNPTPPDLPFVNPTPPPDFPFINPAPPTTTTPFANPTSPPSPPTTITGPPPTTTGPPPTTITGPPPTTTGPPPTTTAPASSGGSWCVANPTATQTALQVALDYACGYGGADCSEIQPNGPCFDPATLKDHASYAFNSYYQKNPVPTSCVFGGAAQLTNTDPSHGSCRFASATTTPTTTTPVIPPPTILTPPSISAPFNPITPGGGNGFDTEPMGGGDYGAGGPTGVPNSAETISRKLLLLISISSLMLSLVHI